MQRRDFLIRTGMAMTAGPCVQAWSHSAAELCADEPLLVKALSASALCVAPHVRAAEAAAAILQQGGNAFDAVVAAGFVMAVVAPHQCGIGGYAATAVGFEARTKSIVALDANAVAPRAATADMFPIVAEADSLDYRLTNDKHKRGPLSVAVPGVLAGLLQMLEAWGSLDRKVVMAPAIAHARDGVALLPDHARAWLAMKEEAERGHASGDTGPLEVVPMDELAETLETIADEGSRVFYFGRLGRRICDHLRKLGGIVTPDDFAAYRALVVEPLTVDVQGHSLATPPPGAGGLTSLQMVALFDRLFDRGAGLLPASATAFETLLEIAKVVWEERLTQLGDAASMARPPQTFLAADHLEELATRVAKGLAHPSPGRVIAPDPLKGTAHLAAADATGNVAALTVTHGGGFGSHVMVPGTGIVLGHGMCRFEPRPGWANSIAPGRRPLHNMSPLIAVKDGRPVLATGASGGRTIVNNSANVIIGRLIHGLSGVDAIAAPRMQCESNEPAIIESAAGADCIITLRARGHDIKETPRDGGTASLIVRDGEAWTGVADPRNPRTVVVAVRPRSKSRIGSSE
jgi:gamma-glutamyltranspeptidase/glutathione hydrolase